MAWRKINELFRQLGIANGLIYLVAALLQRTSGGRARLIRYILVAQPVLTDEVPALRPARGSRIRTVTSSDPIVSEFPRAAPVIVKRFEDSAKCLVAEVHSRFAGYLWLAFESYEEDEVRCRYVLASPEASAWDFDVYIAPEFRMGRTFARLWEAAFEELASRGVRWTFSRISAFNPGSLASHERMGMHRLFSATFICLGTLQIALVGSYPFAHIGWSRAARPVLRLQLPEPESAGSS